MRIRNSWRLAMVVAFVLAAVVGVWGFWDSDGRRTADLGAAEWDRLRERLLNRTVQVPPPSPPLGAVTPRLGPAPSSRPPPAPMPAPAQRTRREWPAIDPGVLADQAEAYRAPRPKTVVELQPFRRADTMPIEGPNGRGTATLINLNPTINAWYLLSLRWNGRDTHYHLVNTQAARQDLVLDPEFPAGLTVASSNGLERCDLWSAASQTPIAEAATSPSPYVPLCQDQITLRLPTAGRKTAVEKVTDFLRTRVWFGEAIAGFVKGTFFEDAFLSTAELAAASEPAGDVNGAGPAPALVGPAAEGQWLLPVDLGISLDGTVDGRVTVGRWYDASDTPGITVSVIRPNLVAPSILASHRALVGALDEVEANALAYLVAFDLDRFDVAFAMGTDHPGVEWSDRAPAAVRDRTLPGPDGIGTIAPLVAMGIIGPPAADRVAATFTGGFKRTHGAFRTGELSTTNSSSHYGFVEAGVVLSKLQPGLSTLLVMADDSVELKTWQAADNGRLADVKFARQNGVPILEADPATGKGVPGPYVNRWGLGNWSGAQDGRLRSLRAGACLQERGSKRFLIYGYFSTATPSAMARVFQAYGCRYAMHLDMNALEHTYLAVYRLHEAELRVEHLIQGMHVLDRTANRQLLPRFLAYADNRDFFYLLWREDQAHRR